MRRIWNEIPCWPHKSKLPYCGEGYVARTWECPLVDVPQENRVLSLTTTRNWILQITNELGHWPWAPDKNIAGLTPWKESPEKRPSQENPVYNMPGLWSTEKYEIIKRCHFKPLLWGNLSKVTRFEVAYYTAMEN